LPLKRNRPGKGGGGKGDKSETALMSTNNYNKKSPKIIACPLEANE